MDVSPTLTPWIKFVPDSECGMQKLMGTRLDLHKQRTAVAPVFAGVSTFTDHRSPCRQASSLIQIKYMRSIYIVRAELRSRWAAIVATAIRLPLAAGEPDARHVPRGACATPRQVRCGMVCRGQDASHPGTSSDKLPHRQPRLAKVMIHSLVRLRKGAAGILVTLLLNCAAFAAELQLPPLNDPPTGLHLSGKLVWADLTTPDPDAARRFYGELFGWTFTSVGSGKEAYALAHIDGVAIAGIVRRTDRAKERSRSRWIPFLSARDVPATERAVTRAGGKSLISSRTIAARGTLAVLADSEGAVFGALDSTSGDPAICPKSANGSGRNSSAVTRTRRQLSTPGSRATCLWKPSLPPPPAACCSPVTATRARASCRSRPATMSCLPTGCFMCAWPT